MKLIVSLPYVTRIYSPFEAVLLISFGGPEGRSDIQPFLKNVLRGRQSSAKRIKEVAQHYELFDGVSPITSITKRQAVGLRARLNTHGPDIPVFIGMRNWHPFLDDTLQAMADAGLSRAFGLILAAHHSYSSCGQYKQNVVDARQVRLELGKTDVEIVYGNGWHTHSGFIAANASHIQQAKEKLPSDLREKARLIFTAHSIPTSMAKNCRYEAELNESARLIAENLETDDWALAYQSRGGRPSDQWLEPDICDYLQTERQRGLRAAVIAPLGFVADHIEVLYDLDTEAAAVSKEINLSISRAETVNDHPKFLDALAEITRNAYTRFSRARQLPLVSSLPPETVEGLPVAR